MIWVFPPMITSFNFLPRNLFFKFQGRGNLYKRNSGPLMLLSCTFSTFFFYRNTFCNPEMTLYLMTWRCKYTHWLMFYFHKCKIYRCPCFFFVCRFLQIGNNCDLDSSNCDLCLHCKIKLDSSFPPSSPSLFCAPSTFAHQRFWLFFGCYVFLPLLSPRFRFVEAILVHLSAMFS